MVLPCSSAGPPLGAPRGALLGFGGSSGALLELFAVSFWDSSELLLGLLWELFLGLFSSRSSSWGSFGALRGLLKGSFGALWRSPFGALLGDLLGSFWSSFLELLFGGFVWGCFKAIETLCRKECRILISFSNSLPAKC